jgi:hypothetical protein
MNLEGALCRPVGIKYVYKALVEQNKKVAGGETFRNSGLAA